MNNKTKIIAYLGVLTALYVVMALTLKIPFGVGNIALDLGYIVLTVSCVKFGWISFVVGGMGALLESLLFSAYGISYGWIAMNIIIGIICGLVLKNYAGIIKGAKTYLICIAVIVFAVLLGAIAKTVIECSLYSIPYVVKIPKSLVAWIIDSVVMIIGLPIANRMTKEVTV